MASKSTLCRLVRLRQANQEDCAESLAEVQQIVARLRNRWPKLKILLRGDSGFCREELLLPA